MGLYPKRIRIAARWPPHAAPGLRRGAPPLICRARGDPLGGDGGPDQTDVKRRWIGDLGTAPDRPLGSPPPVESNFSFPSSARPSTFDVFNPLMKALTLALCVLALLGSAASGYFWWQIGDTKNQLQASLSTEQARASGLQRNLDETATELETFRNRLAAESAELGDAKRKLTASEAQNVQAAREVASLKTTLSAKEKSEKDLNDSLEKLRRDLVQARLAAQVGSSEEVEKYKETIASLEARLGSLQSGEPVAAGAAGSTAPKGPVLSDRALGARVATVGSKNAFVVLELGTKDGVTPGLKFVITRGGQTIAEAVLSEVNASFSIAQVVPSSIKTTLQAGDVAAYVN